MTTYSPGEPIPLGDLVRAYIAHLHSYLHPHERWGMTFEELEDWKSTEALIRHTLNLQTAVTIPSVAGLETTDIHTSISLGPFEELY